MGRRPMHKPEEIVAKLRQMEVLIAGGKSASFRARMNHFTHGFGHLNDLSRFNCTSKWKSPDGWLPLAALPRMQGVMQVTSAEVLDEAAAFHPPGGGLNLDGRPSSSLDNIAGCSR